MKLKAFLIAALALGLTACKANAAWTGCYVGAQAGVAATNTATGFDVAGAGTLLDIKGLGASGGVFGVHAGCDVKIQQFVVGGFADYAWHNQAIEINSPLLGGQIAKLSAENQWTIGARAGIAFTDATLVYGLIGRTSMQMGDLEVLNGAAAFDVKSFEGWTYGGGLATEIMPNVRLAIEYRYAKFDKQTVDLIPGFLSTTLRPDQHTVQGRLSYNFDLFGK